ncbi:DUF5615 family PIN-like protein [Niabella aquatica]
MMTIWMDAQLSPSLAAWINSNYTTIQAHSVRSLGLRDAPDIEIFKQAKEKQAIVMTKDEDFLHLQEQLGAPPVIIWVTAGNTSNARMRELLGMYLDTIIRFIKDGECLIEISGG